MYVIIYHYLPVHRTGRKREREREEVLQAAGVFGFVLFNGEGRWKRCLEKNIKKTRQIGGQGRKLILENSKSPLNF